jgi:hypothetical protein
MRFLAVKLEREHTLQRAAELAYVERMCLAMNATCSSSFRRADCALAAGWRGAHLELGRLQRDGQAEARD